MKTSNKLGHYFDLLESELKNAYSIAEKARKKGYDPEERVDIPLAKGISERVEGLISAVTPQIIGSGVAQRIRKLELQYGSLDWRVALTIAEEVAKQKYCKFESELKAMETGIRVGLAYITLGVIAAPLEGFIELKAKQRRDGKKYISSLYAGPIRAAGGTAEAVSLIIADYVRLKMGYESYDPDETEVKRYVTELRDYNEYVTNLQYMPSEEEIIFLIKNLAIEIGGDPTEEREVSNYKDLNRIETNRIRGGMCLVLAEGLAQKAPKLAKKINKWGEAMGLKWDFINDFISLQKKIKAKGKGTGKTDDSSKISPNFTFIKDLVAGRPVLSGPLRWGGLRLRYGRNRITGLAAAGIHPATMHVLDKYIATGTQIKVERPGKAAAIVPADHIDGPIVLLNNGSVKQLDTEAESKRELPNIKRILYLGDFLVNYGDFSENGHKLVPCGYCSEWWVKELEKVFVSLFGTVNLEKASGILPLRTEDLNYIFKNPTKAKLTSRLAFVISEKLGVPLHPSYTYFWKAITPEQLAELSRWINTANFKKQDGIIEKVILTKAPEKQYLEKIGLPHDFINNEFVVINGDHGFVLEKLFIGKSIHEGNDVLQLLCDASGIIIRDKGGTFIGARMGRPEKAKMRKLKGSPHVLFPVGNEGGRLRSIQSALEEGKITADFSIYKCPGCKSETVFSVCEACGKKTIKQHFCETCGTLEKPCKIHGSKEFKQYTIPIKSIFSKLVKRTNDNIYPDLIKGVKGTINKDHVPEHLFKGILRAKHDIHVNKDGTTRYDMIELPVTHFKPSEIGTSIQTLKKIGYDHDIHGKALESEGQVLELYPQDIILPSCPDSPDEAAEDVLFRVANFIDELLIKHYNLPPYYNLRSKKDLVGHLVVGLAPHTSAGILGRIIGFSRTQGMFTHPMYHAAMRRNCDGDESCAMMLMDCFLNFSRSFLPDRRGSRTMDAPLVLTSLLDPSEVDDEVHGMDIVWEYPLELYEAAQEYKFPWEVSIRQISDVLDTNLQFEGMGYTHELSDINAGVLCSSYKTLPSMQEKLDGQMNLAVKISAIDPEHVAELVIEKHLLKDIKGNLRKFSTQQFRCVQCNEKYRRPPLRSICSKCGGKIIFTISEGSVIKYMNSAKNLGTLYNVSPYLKQTLSLLEYRLDAALGKEKERQEALGKWF